MAFFQTNLKDFWGTWFKEKEKGKVNFVIPDHKHADWVAVNEIETSKLQLKVV